MIKQLELKANEIRSSIIEMLLEAGSGHSAGPLGFTDVLTALYFEILTIDPHKPEWKDRDRFVLSCEHICPALYATLSHRGFFPRSELNSLRKLGSPLQGQPHRGALPGVETSSGPLGQGLSQAIGMAEAAGLQDGRWRVYVALSDGEHNEGQTWEAILYAGARRLHNLTTLVDRNNIQIDGYTEDVMPLEPLADKYRAFGWHVLEANGHDMAEILASLRHARAVFEKPTVVIFHTIPGRGVDFMEGDYKWHGTPPDKKQAKQALAELRSLRGKIRAEHE